MVTKTQGFKIMSNCIFCKIINKIIPATIVYEDDDLIAFYDAYPKARVHFLIIPKAHIESMLQLDESHKNLIGNLMIKANKIAKNLGLDGYKVRVNTGVSGGQEVFHLHVHILGD
jgi:histidine triad (HIT) family protein